MRRILTAILTTLAAAAALLAIAAAIGSRRQQDEASPGGTKQRALGRQSRVRKELDAHYGSARPAGPESAAIRPEDWSEVDEASDESFPASDPPSFATPRAR